jgi:UPF0755 protein
MKFKRILFFILLAVFAAGSYVGIVIYKKFFALTVVPHKDYVNIPTGATFNEVIQILKVEHIVADTASFSWAAKKMKYPDNIHPGHYKLLQRMNNKDLIALLRSGKQTPVHLIFNNLRTVNDLASIVSNTIEADSISILNLLQNDEFLKPYGFNSKTSISMFIPNTYEFYWNTSAQKFMERMTKEYKRFWTPDRKVKAISIGLTQTEVSTVASIIEKETQRADERPMVAGVYMNRYKKGWKLEADPTLVFALGNFNVQRVLNEYKEIDSPYNTYMYAGLPPGPICMPSISSIDAVLNYTKHDYMFFCARDDFSGYHSFAKTYSAHLLNARRFQKELNRRNIRS